MKGITILIATFYLWHSKGFSERNCTLLLQFLMLTKLLEIPFVLTGDFNISYEEFEGSECPGKFGARTIHPGMQTTINTSCDRCIDFALVSKSLVHMLLGVQAIHTAPWSPHYFFVLLFHSVLRQLEDSFKSKWGNLSDDDEERMWKHAVNSS